MNEPREKAETPELLKVDEAAARCRVSRPTMYRLIERGVVPAVRVGEGGAGPVRVPAAELDAWLYKPEQAA
jgi:excisionase family DNA binding protein